MARVLGLDSGGTKTIAAVADRSGRVVARVSGEGLDPTAGDGWEVRLAGLVAPLGPVDAATLGMPFHGEIPEISARQISVATALFGASVQVLNDVAVGFEGALAGRDGVLILAGTGSMAWARGPLGTVRTGGWGDVFGDEGSAFWIGREALGMVSRHLDGRNPSAAFAQGVLGRLGIAGSDLIGWTYRQDHLRAGIAAVAVHVSDLADHGDAEARRLMQRAAAHLSELGRAAAEASGTGAPLLWSVAGGVFRDATLSGAVTALMASDPVPPRLPPVGGAILSAARAAGWAADDAFITRLNRSLIAQTPP